MHWFTCCFVLFGLLLASGCIDSQDPSAMQDGATQDGATQLKDASKTDSDEVPDPPHEVVEMIDVGPALPHRPGEVLQRGVTIHSEQGDVELTNGILVYGDANAAMQDPETGQLAWRAMTCKNPKCPSAAQPGPHIFAHSVAGATVDSEGVIQAKGPPDVLTPVCPACKRRNTVEEYVLPEVVKRHAELDEELSALSATPLPAGVRPPMEIVRDRLLQPQLYLLPQ